MFYSMFIYFYNYIFKFLYIHSIMCHILSLYTYRYIFFSTSTLADMIFMQISALSLCFHFLINDRRFSVFHFDAIQLITDIVLWRVFGVLLKNSFFFLFFFFLFYYYFPKSLSLNTHWELGLQHKNTGEK